ncbi:hypothetical protein [Serinicoccus kebangsaanensis]|uniref:hypothetical protein n=1 Tax=Serinicoccus kebangsaanensis TaxID=2602069 RepID=UPI00124F1EFF|nr:hypothetical protein [Serinicoccus kebangsaanensis]
MSHPRAHRALTPGLMAPLALTALLLAGCSPDVGPGEETQELPSATVSDDEAAASGQAGPDGWITRQSAGFTLSTPEDWHVPEEQYRLQGPVLQVEFPFTGQPTPPPRLLGFLERGAVGDLATRESLLRAMLESQLPADATLGESTTVEVDGADDAVEFESTYTTEDSTSYLDTELQGTTFRQVELLIETEGTPKLGFRYSAPTADFDEQTWERIRDSIQVRQDELREAAEEEVTDDAVEG